MATLFSYGGKDVVIDQSQKEACIQEILQKIIAQQGREPRKMLLLPPDMTRLHSNAGTITQIIYKLLSSKAHIDIMPAIGTHFVMTEAEIREIGNVYRIFCAWNSSPFQVTVIIGTPRHPVPFS